MSVLPVIALTWAAVVSAYLIFQEGRARGRAEAELAALRHFAPLLPALAQLSEAAEALGTELDAEARKQFDDAIRRAASWN